MIFISNNKKTHDEVSQPLFSVLIAQYNNGRFFDDCYKSIMAQTYKNWEVIIVDDGSTDRTKEVIQNWKSENESEDFIIKPIFQTENQYSKGIRGLIARFNLPRARGKYIALCEGDDYWTDSLKLQKQVDFLEKNEEYSLVVSGFKSINTITGEEFITIKNVENTIDNTEQGFDITLERFFKQWITKTLTLTFLKEMYNSDVLKKYKFSRDVHLIYHLLKKGKGYYMKEIFGTYHIHQGGIFSLIDNHQKQLIHFLIFQEIYKQNKDIYSKIEYRKGLVNAIATPLKYKEIKQTKALLFFSLLILSKNKNELIHVLKLLYNYTIIKTIVYKLNLKIRKK